MVKKLFSPVMRFLKNRRIANEKKRTEITNDKLGLALFGSKLTSKQYSAVCSILSKHPRILYMPREHIKWIVGRARRISEKPLKMQKNMLSLEKGYTKQVLLVELINCLNNVKNQKK